MKISIIMTCFNRAEKTKNCIDTLLKSFSDCSIEIESQFFVCNDGSTDDTSIVLNSYGSLVKEIQGTGKLFWARGMACALAEAEKYTTDFYLMVNDDVEFLPNAMQIMIDSYRQCSDKSTTIVGATLDGTRSMCTYGGYVWNGKAIGKQIVPVLPGQNDGFCNTANWNCVLIPVNVYETVGTIDTVYEHSFADFDYSNRIVSHGFAMRVAYDYIGICERNQNRGTWRDSSLPISKRFKLLNRPNGFPPKSSWHYAKKYYGVAAPYMFIRPYISILASGLKGRK